MSAESAICVALRRRMPPEPMAAAGAYNETVRRHFANPLHAGELPSEYARARTVEVSGGDARVLLSAGLSGDRLDALRYRVYGCPHLIARPAGG